MKRKFGALLAAIVCTIVCGENIAAQARYSLVISEIMADPTPQIGLPNAEWIELRNASAAAINLQGYRLQKPGTTASGPLPNLLLAPDSSIVVCTASQVAALAVFGRTTSVTSFPSLGNDGDELILLAPNGSVMHNVRYSSSWYRNTVKADGGWTLEMIDPRNACSGADNWTASNDSKGGTPGQPNSALRSNADQTAPRLLRAAAINSSTLQLQYNESMDSTRAATAASYRLSDGLQVQSASTLPASFARVNVQVAPPMAANRIYTVEAAASITDCAGNGLNPAFSTVRAGLFAAVDSLDVVVNEILFNPKSPGVDYVELYNRSNKIINLQELLIANRSSSGAVASFVPISAEAFAFFPGDFVVLTTDANIVAQQYTVRQPAAILTLSSLPSYPDDKGTVVVVTTAGRVIDEVPFDARWHFALVDDEEGIALERIDANGPSNSRDNWTSAASTAGFGTPTAANSQLKAATQAQGDISISPKIFSPDNDGFEDFALIEFRFPQAGYVANVTIMDAAGRAIRVLQRNTTCAQSGSWRWDGLNDKLQRVPVGTYIIFTEIFNLQGNKRVFKNTVTVARKF